MGYLWVTTKTAGISLNSRIKLCAFFELHMVNSPHLHFHCSWLTQSVLQSGMFWNVFLDRNLQNVLIPAVDSTHLYAEGCVMTEFCQPEPQSSARLVMTQNSVLLVKNKQTSLCYVVDCLCLGMVGFDLSPFHHRRLVPSGCTPFTGFPVL